MDPIRNVQVREKMRTPIDLIKKYRFAHAQKSCEISRDQSADPGGPYNRNVNHLKDDSLIELSLQTEKNHIRTEKNCHITGLAAFTRHDCPNEQRKKKLI